MLLSVSGVGKTFGPSQILDDIAFHLAEGDRAGLVGANGAGKSTLFRIITGEVEPDGGSVRVHGGAVVGYLPQQPPDPPGATLDDLVYDAVGELRALESRLRELEAAMADPDADFDAALAEYGELQERFERRGGYELDHRVDAVFAGLRIEHLARDRHFASLSGGEKSRVLLATLLLRAPDLLLLDEPTNHLDFASIAWLEAYLARQQGGLLVISHDRHFLNATVTRILELDESTHQLREYAGDYDAYAAIRAAERARWEAEYQAQQEEIRELRHQMKVSGRQVAHNRAPRDPAKMQYDFKAGKVATAISRNVRSAEERLRRIEADPVARPTTLLRISPELDPAELRSDSVIVTSGLDKAWGARAVLREVSFTLGPRDRVVIVGPNGAGKSTLLDVIAGHTAPDAGTVTVARAARIGYLDQEARGLDPARTLFETYREGLVGTEAELINDLFHNGLLRIDDLGKPVGTLSSGQRRKLQVARLIAERANVLLLDEPTNHLSFDVLEELERALVEFQGPILAVSHDRWFIERFGEAGAHVWELRDGRLIQHANDAGRVLARLIESGEPLEVGHAS